MSVAAQTFSRSNFREFAFTIDNVKRREIEHSFSHSPALAIFAGQTLGDFGGTRMAGRGHGVEGGGHAVIKRVTLGAHAGAGRAAGPFGTHNVAPDDNTRFAEGNWKFYNHGLAVSEHDLAINRGDLAIASFLESQTRGVLRATADLVADDLYSTSAPSTAITDLQALIGADDSVHGLNGSTYAKYNARGVSARGTAAALVSFASGSFAAQGLADLRTCYNNASEGMVQPDVHLTSYGNHERYEGALLPQERFQGTANTADGSFMALTFKGKPVLADPKCADGDWYMVSLDPDSGVRLHVLQGADFDFGEWKPSTTQAVMVRPLFLTCELMIGNRQFGSNRLTSITD